MNKSIENYDGDIILMKRLVEFFPDYWEWDNSGKIYLNDINNALQKSLPEINDFYGDEFLYPVVKQRTRGWHIGRILYFIKHKAEIKDIEIDNEYSGFPKLHQWMLKHFWILSMYYRDNILKIR